MNDQDSNVDGGKKENGKNAGSIEPDARLTESNNSVIDQSKIEMVFNEDTLWKSLALRKLDRGFEGKQAVAGSYIELASFYERAGGYEAAAKFVKNALAIVDDTDLKLYLARLQGRSRGVDFIVSFNDVLKDSQYNLKLALEFCYFLEIKGYHDAAIDILETELRKRLRVNASDASEAATINGFLTLLQIQIDVDSTIRMEHYKELFSENFPSEIIVDVNIINYTPFATIVEQDLVEYEEQWGGLSRKQSIMEF